MTEISITYYGENTDPKLPGFDNIEVVNLLELDDDIVLDGSLAYTGIKRRTPFDVLDCEIFFPEGFGEEWLEVYPLDGKNQPILVDYEIGNLNIADEAVLLGVVKSAFTHIENDENLEL